MLFYFLFFKKGFSHDLSLSGTLTSINLPSTLCDIHHHLIHYVTFSMDSSSHNLAIHSPQNHQTTKNPSPSGPATPALHRKPPPVPRGRKPTTISMETFQEIRSHHPPTTRLHPPRRSLFSQISQGSAENTRFIILQQAKVSWAAEALLQQHGHGVRALRRLLEGDEEDHFDSSP